MTDAARNYRRDVLHQRRESDRVQAEWEATRPISEVVGCNYPGCGCDWDAICETEVDRRSDKGPPLLIKFCVGGIVACGVALAIVGGTFIVATVLHIAGQFP